MSFLLIWRKDSLWHQFHSHFLWIVRVFKDNVKYFASGGMRKSSLLKLFNEARRLLYLKKIFFTAFRMAQSSTLRVRRYVWYYADLEALRYMISMNCVTKEGYYLDIQNSLLINMVYLSERLYKLRSTKIKIYSYYNLKSTVEIQ